ncbi:MAG: hypothetical protein JW795_14160, partial [Chitinivibrionales bacterium]|nr:hypothetical protein [Chitinivibrionales bacterium]
MPKITIQLDSNSYDPGSALNACISWDVDQEKTHCIDMNLLWFTEGKGTPDYEVVQTVHHETPLRCGQKRFCLNLPLAPWSFSGRLISLVWAVEARIDSNKTLDRIPFIMAPQGK